MKPETTATQIETVVSEETPTQAWQRPVITRVDIKRTMFDGGSFVDGNLGTSRK
jgi:hypothetical protein